MCRSLNTVSVIAQKPGLRESEELLGQAQRLAKVGSWRGGREFGTVNGAEETVALLERLKLLGLHISIDN